MCVIPVLLKGVNMTALETEIDCLFTGKFTAWPAAAEASLHWGPIMTTLCVGLQLISGDHAKVSKMHPLGFKLHC